MNRSGLIHKIASLIRKGDQATTDAEQYYAEAGRQLCELKTLHDAEGGTWAQWEDLLRVKFDIGRSRASELMQMATGKVTSAQVKTKSAARQAGTRARRKTERKQISPRRRGEDSGYLIRGKDGKLRPLPPGEKPVIALVHGHDGKLRPMASVDKWWHDEVQHEPGASDEKMWRDSLLFRARAAAGAALYEDWSMYRVDETLLTAVTTAADAWSELVKYLRRIKNGKSKVA